MATLEKRSGAYRVIFYYCGRRFARSLKTSSQRAALASLARLDDNLRRVELGLLSPPPGADFASFLLSDGRVEAKPALPRIGTLKELFDYYFASIPVSALEASTLKGMRLHVKHLKKHLGSSALLAGLEAHDLQRYIERRSPAKGLHGRTLSAATIKKEIVTLRTAWNWSFNMGLIHKPFPNRGLRFPKLAEKPPFRTFDEIRRRVERGGLTVAQTADLWDSVFLTLEDVSALLEHVQRAARHEFLYPMFVFAAHTGARRSEIIRSTLDDLDLASQAVLIHERKRVKGRLSTRRVPLSPLLSDVLRAWVARHPGGTQTFCLDVDVAKSKKSRGFTTPLTVDEAHDHFKRALAGSRWSHLRGWHVFRHSFCSNCAARGVDQRVINAWVGHQTDEMVRRYRHLLPNQEQAAIRSVFRNDLAQHHGGSHGT